MSNWRKEIGESFFSESSAMSQSFNCIIKIGFKL